MSKFYLSILLLLSIISIQAQSSDTSLISKHLSRLTKTPEYRTHLNVNQLNYTADYIDSIFRLYADSVYFQTYSINGSEYKNVICSFGLHCEERIIIGAHYDVCGNQEGADDNASGITGLLELARLLYSKELKYRIDLVAFTLEEPPHFRTENMGSFHHAQYLSVNKIKVKGMICLEMIGFFKDERKTQEYPIKLLSLIYGNKGNYITLVNKFNAGKFAKRFGRYFKKSNSIKTKKFTGPPGLPGIDFSDHLNYWKFGYSALMVTDTAFYRNKNYHHGSDTMESLDINRMSKVIDSVFYGLINLK